jgi:hypothetical protein
MRRIRISIRRPGFGYRAHNLDVLASGLHAGRMRYLMILPLLCACESSPMPGMANATKAEVTEGGRAYSLWYTETRVEIVRHGWVSPGDHQAVRATMIALIPQVTGCTLNEASLIGDSGEMRGAIRC